MWRTKLEIIAFLLFCGGMLYLIFSGGGEPQPEVSPNFPAMTSSLAQPEAPLPEPAVNTRGHKAAPGTEPYANPAVPAQPVTSNSDDAATAEPYSIHELEFIPGKNIHCNPGMTIPLIAMDFDKDQLQFNDVSHAVQWRIDNPAIARISDGMMHCLAVGESDVQASIGSHSQKLHITVFDSPVESLSLAARGKLKVGGFGDDISISLHFANGERIRVTDAELTVSDSSVARIVQPFRGFHVLQGLREGSVRVHARYLGLSAEQDVTVIGGKSLPDIAIVAMDGMPSEKRIATHPIHLVLGEAIPFLGISDHEGGRPEDDVNPDALNWSVSDPTVIALEPVRIGAVNIPLQRLIAKAAGTAEVRVSYGTLQASTTVVVHDAKDGVLKINIPAGTIRVADHLKAVVFRSFRDGVKRVSKPESTLQWSSSDSRVLSVQQSEAGVDVRAVGEGEADLIVLDGEQRASVHVRVSAHPTAIQAGQGLISLSHMQLVFLQRYIALLFSDGYRRGIDDDEAQVMTLTSADPDILKVFDDRTVKAVGVGQTQLHLSLYGIAVDVPVNVKMKPAEVAVVKRPVSITLQDVDPTLPLGSSGHLSSNGHLKISLLWDNGEETRGSDDLVWQSSRPDVIEVSAGGRYRAMAAGEAVLQVSLKDHPEITASKRFVVPEVSINRLYLDQGTIHLPVGSGYDRISVWAERSQGGKADVAMLATVTIEDDTTAKILRDGMIQAIKAGETRMHFAYAGKEAVLTVVVHDAMPPLSLNCQPAGTNRMIVNEQFKIRCNPQYSDAHIHLYSLRRSDVSFSSSNNAVLTIRNGTAWALQSGTAELDVAFGGLHERLTVSVSQPTLLRRSLSAPDSMEERSSGEWSVTEYYDNGLQRDCREEPQSSDRKIIHANRDGALIAFRPGQAVLHAYCKGEHLQKTITVVAASSPAR